MEALKTLIEELYNLLRNLRKDGPNRKRSEESGKQKLKQVEEIVRKARIEAAEIEKAGLTKEEKSSLHILYEKLVVYESEATLRIQTSMTNSDENSTSTKYTEKQENPKQNIIATTDKMADFDFSTAQKLPVLNVDQESKRGENLRDFINSVEFYHDMLKQEAKPILVKFLLKCKVQGKALTELGSSTPNSFAELKTELQKKCGTKETIEQIQNKLSNTRQGHRPMKDFTNDIENLIVKMTELEVNAQGEEARTVLTETNERRGLTFLKKGVNDRFKIVLDSARHTKLQDAIQHLLELDPGPTTSF